MKTYFTILVLAVITLSSCSKVEIAEDIYVEVNAEASSEMENELFNLVNEHRASIGLNTLVFDEVVYAATTEHTKYMVSIGDTSHANFDKRASGIASKKSVKLVAENLAKDYDNAQEALNGWLNSSGHKRNLEGDYTHAAISIMADQNGDLYFTQIFYR